MTRRAGLHQAEFTTERYSRSVALGAVGTWPGSLPGAPGTGAPGPQAQKHVSWQGDKVQSRQTAPRNPSGWPHAPARGGFGGVGRGNWTAVNMNREELVPALSYRHTQSLKTEQREMRVTSTPAYSTCMLSVDLWARATTTQFLGEAKTLTSLWAMEKSACVRQLDRVDTLHLRGRGGGSCEKILRPKMLILQTQF